MALPVVQHHYDEMIQSHPGLLMVELHDEAITALTGAVEAIAAHEIETRFNETAAAMQAVTALYAMLDRDNGGELAANLSGVYEAVLTKLGRICFTNDPALAGESIELLSPLREAWAALEQRENGAAKVRKHARNIISGAKSKSDPVRPSTI
jgi:flagellar protein FliS